MGTNRKTRSVARRANARAFRMSIANHVRAIVTPDADVERLLHRFVEHVDVDRKNRKNRKNRKT